VGSLADKLAQLALLLFVVLNAITGIRLLRLAARTRELPELALGIAHLFGGSLGWAIVAVGFLVTTQLHAPAAGTAIAVAGHFCLNAAVTGVALFSWRVFNPTSGAMKALFVAFVVTLVADLVHNGFMVHDFSPPTTQFWYWPGSLGRSGAYLWMTIVTLLYYRKLRLRLQHGLADPVTANRMFLVYLAGSFIVLLSIVVTIGSVQGWWQTHQQLMSASSSLLGIPSAFCSWLAFVPPRRYTAWIARRNPVVAE
jgi:hypothetical protein